MTGEATVEGVLWAMLSLTVLKTALVANTIWGIFSSARRVVSAVGRVADSSSPRSGHSTALSAPSSSSRRLDKDGSCPPMYWRREGALDSPECRWLSVSNDVCTGRVVRQRLLLMHLLGTLAQLAGITQYVVPVTESGCVVTHRVMMASLVLFDGTTVLFLLAKTQVTNNVMGGSAVKSCWEVAAWRFSNFWAWICTPAIALLCAFALPGGVDDEDGSCHGGIESSTVSDATLFFFIAFTTGKFVLTVEFMLLLALFIKPLFARDDDSQLSVNPRHRRTVFRNIACTMGMVAVELGETIVVFTVLFHKGSTAEVERIADAAAVVQVFLVLFLTEITMPLGFAALCGWRRASKHGSNSGGGQTCVSETKSGKKSTAMSTSSGTNIKTVNANGRTGSNRAWLGSLAHAPVHVMNEETEEPVILSPELPYCPE